MVRLPVSSPRARSRRTSAGSSMAGRLSGRVATVVMPLDAAASGGEAIVSRYSKPGSPRAARMSTSPGQRMAPPPSTSVTPSGRPRAPPRSAMQPSRTSSAPGASSPEAGSIRRTPVMRMSDIPARPAGQGVQDGHAHGDTHFYLFADQAADRIVGDGAVDLHPAIHWAGMHHQRVRRGAGQAGRIEAGEAQ